MEQKKNLGIKILQIAAIVVLVLALLSSVCYFAVTGSINKAVKENTLPTLFGKMYLPVTSDNVEDIAKPGSLILAQKASAKDFSAGQAVVYEAPSVSKDNVVFRNYSVGIVNSVSEQDGDTVLSVQTASGVVAVASSLVKGEATHTAALLGNIVTKMQAQMGFFGFVVIPVFLFVVLQLLVVILRTLGGRPEMIESEEDEEDDQDEDEITYEETDENEYENLTIVRPRANVQATRIKSETVSTINGEYGLKSDILKPFIEEDEPVRIAEIPESPAVQVKPEGDYVRTSPTVSAFSKLNHNISAPVQTPETASVDDELERKLMSQQTMEFDMTEIRERMMQEELLRDEEEQDYVKTPDNHQVLDKILIEVKDHAVDFSFQNLKTEGVEVEKNGRGDGFVINTPKYKATIRVEIDQK